MSYTKGKLKVDVGPPSDYMEHPKRSIRAESGVVCDMRMPNDFGCGCSITEVEANARELVKRWNCHKDLVEALEELDATYQDRLIDNKGCTCLRCKKASQKAKAALAAAQA